MAVEPRKPRLDKEPEKWRRPLQEMLDDLQETAAAIPDLRLNTFEYEGDPAGLEISLGVPAKAVWLGGLTQLGVANSALGKAIFVQWEPTGTGYKIIEISNLTSTQLYEFTLVALV